MTLRGQFRDLKKEEGMEPMISLPTPEKELKQMDKLLKLSGGQRGQILPLLKDRADAISKLIANPDLSLQERSVQIADVRSTSNEKIRSLLTDSQKQAYDKMLAREQSRRRDEPQDFDGPPDGPPPGDGPPPPPPM